MQLAQSLIEGTYRNQATRIGIEFEFKLDRHGHSQMAREGTRFGKCGTFVITPDFYASFDIADLAEFRSYPVPLDQFDYELHFRGLRRAAANWLKERKIQFLWYGWHLSMWDMAGKDLGKVSITRVLAGEKKLLHSEVINDRDGQHASGWDDDTFYDPFTRTRHRHMLVEAAPLIQEKKQLTYDRASVRRGWAWFSLNHELLREASNRLPIPGCAIRVGKKRRVELVAGWMDLSLEEKVVNTFKELNSTWAPDQIPPQHPDSLRFPGSRGRIATLLIHNHSFDEPPKMPDVDWDNVCFDPAGTWDRDPSEPWPLIGKIPEYWG